jgi:hypothetical protein
MPRGPQGQKRPADVIGAAIMVARLATGEITEPPAKEIRAGAQREGWRVSPRAQAHQGTAVADRQESCFCTMGRLQ